MEQASLKSAELQIRSLLQVLRLIAPEGYEQHQPVERDFSVDWEASVSTRPWRLEYQECSDEGYRCIELKLYNGERVIVEVTSPSVIDERCSVDDRPRPEDIEGNGWYVSVSAETVNVPSEMEWTILGHLAQIYQVREQYQQPDVNPCSPAAMALITWLLNWFAQLPQNPPAPA
jgi:hypothetical protein